MSREKMPAKIAGKIVDVPVCWDSEKVSASLAKWPGGVVDCDKIMDMGLGLGNEGEREWFLARAKGLAGLEAAQIPESMGGVFGKAEKHKLAAMADHAAEPVVPFVSART